MIVHVFCITILLSQHNCKNIHMNITSYKVHMQVRGYLRNTVQCVNSPHCRQLGHYLDNVRHWVGPEQTDAYITCLLDGQRKGEEHEGVKDLGDLKTEEEEIKEG